MNVMKGTIYLLVLCAITYGATTDIAWARPAKEITIPTQGERNLRDGLKYHDSAEYTTAVKKAVDEATAVCTKAVGDPSAAIVVDIDETILDHKEQYRKHHLNPDGSWNWNQEVWNKYATEGNAPGIAPVVDFVKWAHDRKLTIFLITGRHDMLRKATIKNLEALGIPYDELMMEVNQLQPYKPEDLKTDYRRQIERRGYRIVCNIGDQESDLYGLHCEECIKLPNEMYFTD